MNNMFYGLFRRVMDDKRRLQIPGEFIEGLDLQVRNSIVITNHLYCLWAFPYNDWQLIEEKAKFLPIIDKAVEMCRRYFLSGAEECQINNNSVIIPSDLVEIAGLRKNIILVGRPNHFEIWDEAKWTQAFKN